MAARADTGGRKRTWLSYRAPPLP